jgi:hypothetical protein
VRHFVDELAPIEQRAHYREAVIARNNPSVGVVEHPPRLRSQHLVPSPLVKLPRDAACSGVCNAANAAS